MATWREYRELLGCRIDWLAAREPDALEIPMGVFDSYRRVWLTVSGISQREWAGTHLMEDAPVGNVLVGLVGQLAHADRMRILGAIPGQLQVLYELPCECLAGLHDLSPPVVAIGRDFERLYPAAECKVDPAMLAVMRRYVEDHWAAVEGSPPAVIIHNDVHWNNTLVSEGNFGGLVDFDDAEPGWPEMDAFAMVHLLAAAEAPQELTPLARPESMRRACQVVRHLWTGVLETPGCLERYVISRVIGILGDLAEPPPWHTQEESRQEAEQTWQALFQGLGPGSWFQP